MEKELKPASATVIVIILTAILFAAAATTVNAPSGNTTGQAPSDTGSSTASGQPSGKDSMVPYSNPEFGISFEYPSSLYIKSSDTPTQNPPELSISFVKSTQQNIDIVEGRTTEVGEGPTSILIKVQSNMENQSVESFAKTLPTWNVAKSPLAKTDVNGMEAYEYTWSGLYEGRTVIISRNGKLFTLSVDWMDPEEQLVRDFDMILNTLSI